MLGVAGVVHLGYHGQRTRFVRADPEEAAERLAAVLREEDAYLLLSYDAAARGVDRPVGLVRLRRIPFRYDAEALRTAFGPRAAITHTMDVRRFAAQRQAALAAHRTEVSRPGRGPGAGRRRHLPVRRAAPGQPL
ncbi:hypothetical protein BIV25_09845 [Streptomyces sp. MUSC 14]|uniref:hypothetical protein n=1 Tax=Streptomyces sp. MUSC 14 TaxID=1354889 RepID=UPI0008F5AE79|nr:hypothetical protein [Streptomyces sp. MUSC 14]OIJ99314.1 hypothetical protein BIV25_09845 [Streptomyces sp. MUSC 14]